MITAHQDVSLPWIESLVDKILKQVPSQWERGLLQERRPKRAWRLLFGDHPRTSIIEENGLKFQISTDKDQNLGFFLDMKSGRSFVRESSHGMKVLNLFAYTCSLSLAALSGGAKSVCNVDMSKSALSRGRINHQLNPDLDLKRVSFLPHNILKSMGKLEKMGPFDLVIVDPPSDQGQSFNARRDYVKVVRRLPKMLSSFGQVMACLNAPYLNSDFLEQIFTDQNFEVSKRLTPPPEFRILHAEAGPKVQIFKLMP